jgi:hypothetical protein
MKQFLLFSLALACGSATLAAQAVDQYQPRTFDSSQSMATQPTVLTVVPPAPRCPVGMRAQHAPGSTLVRVAPGQPDPPAQRGPAERAFVQRLTMTLTNSKPTGIVAAHVTVHGTTGKPRVMNLSDGRRQPGESVRALDLAFDQTAIRETSAPMAVPGFTSVSRIDLDSVTYADGTTWKSDPGSCSIAPDGMMLVSAR